MAESKKSGYSCQPVTAKIKQTTKGGMKVEQPLIGQYAPVQMNSPAKNIIVRGAGQLIKQGAKKALPAIRKGGAEALKKGKNLLGKTGGAKEFVPKKSLKQRAGRFIKNAITGGIGYAAIDAIFGGSSDGATGALFDKVDKSAETKPTVTPKPGTTTKKKPYVKPGGKATGSMKDYKIGSKERYDEYEARGWAHDDTTKGYKPKKKEAKVSTIKPKGIETSAKQPKVSIETKSPSIPETSKPSKKDLYTAKKKGKAGARKTAKAADKEAQAKKALAEGNTKKAARKQRSADRKKSKAKKKFSQAAQAIEVKSPAMKKGSKKY
jgi:hypothetical protein